MLLMTRSNSVGGSSSSSFLPARIAAIISSFFFFPQEILSLLQIALSLQHQDEQGEVTGSYFENNSTEKTHSVNFFALSSSWVMP